MKTVIEMALEAGFLSRENSSAMYSESDFDGEICMEEYAVGERLKRFAELVRADERNSWPTEMEAMERQVNILTDALAQERKPLTPDMFWNQDDAETPHDSIEEFLNHEICNGYLEVGAVFTLLQAKKFPSAKIMVTSIDENKCEAEYEIIEGATHDL